MSRNNEVAAITDQLDALLDALQTNVAAMSAILDPDGTVPQEVAG